LLVEFGIRFVEALEKRVHKSNSFFNRKRILLKIGKYSSVTQIVPYFYMSYRMYIEKAVVFAPNSAYTLVKYYM